MPKIPYRTIVYGCCLFMVFAFYAGSHQEVNKGALQVDADYPAWLHYGGGSPFFMCGPGDPEGFLYRGTRNADGTRDGDQEALIRKLAGTGANCIYLMMIRSHGGDGGADENPFLDSDANQGLNEVLLDQWEGWFTAMNKAGIVIFLFFYDDSAAPFARELIDGALDRREEFFIDTLVARFKHHPYLIWCVAEEYTEALSRERVSKIAARIKAKDNFNHPVAVHQNHGTHFDFHQDPHVDQFAMQYNTASVEALHEAAVTAWRQSGGRKNINLSEFQPRPTGKKLQETVWAIAFGGAYSMMLHMDIATTTKEDLEICGDLVSFMESVRFNECAPADGLARGGGRYVLAKPGACYLLYTDGAERPGVLLKEGCYRLQWYDILSRRWHPVGEEFFSAGEHYFEKPAGIGDEAVLYLLSCE